MLRNKISALRGRKQSPEHIEKRRQVHIGKIVSAETRKKMSLSKQGRILSESHKNKISQGNKGKHSNPIWLMETLIGRIPTDQTRQKMRDARLGKKIKDNLISTEIEQIRKNDKGRSWSKAVYKKDYYTCQKCRMVGKKLNAHHIKPFRILLKEALLNFPELSIYEAAQSYPPLWDISNGVTLCEACHKVVHRELRKEELC